MPASAEPEDPRADAIDALRELILAGEAFRGAIAHHFGVGVTETAAISYLYARGDQGQTELARSLGITTSSATSLIDRLESNGYAIRTPHPADRRRMVVSLSDKGVDAIRRTRALFRSALGALPEADLDVVVAGMHTVAAGLREQLRLLMTEA